MQVVCHVFGTTWWTRIDAVAGGAVSHEVAVLRAVMGSGLTAEG
jgi:hypothetical protein